MQGRSWFRWLAVLLLMAMLAGVGLAGCAHKTEAPPKEKVLVVAVPSDVETIDPPYGAHQMSNEAMKNIYDQWFRYPWADTGKGYSVADVTRVEGAAIESFTFEPDNKTVHFKVRKGIKFPLTGNELTAEDFMFKLQRAFGLKAGTAWVFNVIGIYSAEQMKVTGPYEFTITLDAPTPLFGPLLRDQTMGVLDSKEVKKHATPDDPWATKWVAKNYAGCGEYLIESWTPGVEVVLKANDSYWASRPYFDKVILRVVPSSANRVLMLKEGSIDIAKELDVEELESLKGVPGVKVLSIPCRDKLAMGLNNKMAPFDNVKVRQALAYAVPYQKIVEGVFRGHATYAKGPVSGNSAYFDRYGLGEFWQYEYNPDKAKQLLKEAGYEKSFTFDLAIQTGVSYAEEAAAILKDAFREIGVTMNINKLSAAVFAEKLAKKEHQAWMRTILPYVDDPYYLYFLEYETGTVCNWSNYSNARVDAIIKEARTTLDDNKRREMFREAVKTVIEECPVLYLADRNFTVAMRDDLQGFVYEPDNLLWYYPLRRKESK